MAQTRAAGSAKPPRGPVPRTDRRPGAGSDGAPDDGVPDVSTPLSVDTRAHETSAGASDLRAPPRRPNFGRTAAASESPIATGRMPTDLPGLHQCVTLLQELSSLAAKGVLGKDQKTMVKELVFQRDPAVTAALGKAAQDNGLALQTLVVRRFPNLQPAPVRLASPKLSTSSTRPTSHLAPAFAQLTVHTGAASAAPGSAQQATVAPPSVPGASEFAMPAPRVGAEAHAHSSATFAGGAAQQAAAGVGAARHPAARGGPVAATMPFGSQGFESAATASTRGGAKSKRTRTPSFRQYSNSPSHVRSRTGPSPTAGQVSSMHAVARARGGVAVAGASATAGKGMGVAGASVRRERPQLRARQRGLHRQAHAKAERQRGTSGSDTDMGATHSAASGGTRGGGAASTTSSRAAAARAKKTAAALAKAKARRNRTEPRRWTSAEDSALKSAVARHGEKNWKAIAEHVPGRNHVQCLQRWKKVLRPGLVKGHWTGDEDSLLRVLVARGPKNWGEVAVQIPGRTAKQCRERWCNHLDPRIKKGGWTPLEDEALVEAQAYLGKKWAQISKYLPGRTENAVKIRWKSLTRRAAARGGSDVSGAQKLLQTTQMAVAKQKAVTAAANADTVATMLAASVALITGAGLAVKGTGYVAAKSGVPVAPATSSDRFSPFAPRMGKDGSHGSGEPGASSGRAAGSSSTGGGAQPLHMVNSKPLPVSSAIVRLAAQAFAEGSSLTRVGRGGVPLSAVGAATGRLPNEPAHRGQHRGQALGMPGLPPHAHSLGMPLGAGLGMFGMGPMGVGLGLDMPLPPMGPSSYGGGPAGNGGAAATAGLPAHHAGGMFNAQATAGVQQGQLGAAGAGARMAMAMAPGAGGSSQAQRHSTSGGVQDAHVGLGGFSVPLVDTSTPRRSGRGRDARAKAEAGAGTAGGSRSGGVLESPFNLSSLGSTSREAEWAWLENAMRCPTDKGSLQRAAAAQAVTSAAAAQATGAVPDELPGDMDIDLDAMFASGDTVDTPSLRASIEEAVAGISTPRLASSAGGGGTTPAFLLRSDFGSISGAASSPLGAHDHASTARDAQAGATSGGRADSQHRRRGGDTTGPSHRPSHSRDAMRRPSFNANPGFNTPSASVSAPSPSSAALLEVLNGASSGMFPFPPSSIADTPSNATTQSANVGSSGEASGILRGFTPRGAGFNASDGVNPKAFDVQ